MGKISGRIGGWVGMGDGMPASNLQRGLEAVRKHLGMEVAYVSEFVAGRSVFREVDAPGLEALIKVGDSQSLDDVYCQHILAGRLPQLMADAAQYPLAAALPITQALPIGAHMSVPIRLPDGQPYGMFCCLSPHPNQSLNQRDLEVMRVFAEMAEHEIAQGVALQRTRQETAARMEAVMAAQQYRFLYQPIVALQTARVVGFEALCRFAPEPYRSPDKWFAEAHASGYGERLELAVLRQAVKVLSVLPEDVYVTVNTAPSTILSGGLAAAFSALPMHRLVLEVTEHAPVEDYCALAAALAPLRKAGARLAVDDAGAGYASLQHILQLRPDIIKLDIGLTRSLDQDPARRALVAALGFFAQETGCEVVAEGIETAAEFGVLLELGIGKGQGYLLGRPGDLDAALAMVEMPAREVATA